MLDEKAVKIYAEQTVERKDWLSRFLHWKTIDPFFRVIAPRTPGEIVAKKLCRAFATLGVNIGAEFINLPLIRSIITGGYKLLYDGVRTHFHDKEFKAATKRVTEAHAAKKIPSPEDLKLITKFELKHLKIEDLDRFRWKLTDSVLGVYQEFANYPSHMQEAEKAGKTCDPLAGIAIAMAQVDRRYKKLTEQLSEVKEVLERAQKWADDTKEQLASIRVEIEFEHLWSLKYKRDVELMGAGSTEAAAKYHANCGDFCYFNSRPVLAPTTKAPKTVFDKVLGQVVGKVVESGPEIIAQVVGKVSGK